MLCESQRRLVKESGKCGTHAAPQDETARIPPPRAVEDARRMQSGERPGSRRQRWRAFYCSLAAFTPAFLAAAAALPFLR